MGAKVALGSFLKKTLPFLHPIYKVVYSVIPLKLLAYLAGAFYGDDTNNPKLYLVVSLIFGTWGGTNLQLAGSIFNQRLLKLPIEERRRCSKYVWQADTAISWAQRAFKNPEQRCSDYVYEAIHELYLRNPKPLSVLELGSMNGGSLLCLLHKGVPLSHFCGVDLCERLIQEAQQKFENYEWAKFFCMDFIEYCNSTSDRFDILLVKQTFLFLDKAYLYELLEVLSRKEIAERIVVREIQLASHVGEDSIYGNWGNVPIDYSHNYELLFKKLGYTFESDNRHLKPKSGQPNTISFEAVLVHPSSRSHPQ